MRSHKGVFAKAIFYTVAALAVCSSCFAQLADGATAPDFTFIDIDGKVQHLYSYLDEGKYVAIDISATWCVPCWNYHNTHVLDSIYDKHDIAGDNTWKVIFIEADESTDSAELHGVGPRTEGDWVAGARYTIIDAPAGSALTNFRNDYQVFFFPMLYFICPDRKLIQDTINKKRPDVAGWEYLTGSCSTTGINKQEGIDQILSIYPNPSTSSVIIDFELKRYATISLSVTDLFGRAVDSKLLGSFFAGKHSLEYVTKELASGVYIFNFSGAYFTGIRKKVVVN